jgi:hypothetical protein
MLLTACPFVSPGFGSKAKVYSGYLLYVTWVVPSLRVVVPSRDLSAPLPAVGSPLVRVGGQAAAHWS